MAESVPDAKLRQMMSYEVRIFRIRSFGMDSTVSQEVCKLLHHFGKAEGSAL